MTWGPFLICDVRVRVGQACISKLRNLFTTAPKAVVVKVWSPDLQHQHQLELVRKTNFWASLKESETLGVGPWNLWFNKLPR